MSNLLRPNQIADYERDRDSLQEKLGNKHIQDKKAVKHQLTRLEKNLEQQSPQEIPASERDAVVKETNELLEDIVTGMPSQEEMRKSPPGAVDKHRVWEKRNKEKILKWKENQLRLNVGTDEVDVANIEKYRPVKSSLNMDNALIPGQDIHIPPTVGHSRPYSDEEIKLIKERAPAEVYGRLALLTAEQRDTVRQQFIELWDDDEKEETPKTEGGMDATDSLTNLWNEEEKK